MAVKKAPVKAGQKQDFEAGMKHFVRVLNTDLDGRKQVIIAMQKIKGVGYPLSNMVCKMAGIDRTKKAGFLSEAEVSKIEGVLKNPSSFPTWMINRRNDYESGMDKHLYTSDLDFTKSNDVRRLQRVKSYRGLRLAWGLPVRGQRTKSNFRKHKGKTLGVQRKKK